MFANVFLKTLRDLRRGLLGWSIALVLLVAVMAALWPSIRDIPDLDELLASYPAVMRELFDVEAISTGAGFLNAELFSILLPALFIVFAVGRGAQLVAGEEEVGTLEVLLATPASRARVLLDKAAALALAATVAVVGYVLYVLGELVESVKPWQALSPFTHAVRSGPLGGGLQIDFLWMALAAVVFLAAAVPVFDRRDVVVH